MKDVVNNYYDEIKNELINNEVYKKVKDYSKNRNELSTYYNVGKLLIEAQGGEDRAKYGDGFSYIGSEYKIKIGNTYNYIDLLLFNIKYNCYVVVELKVTEVKKEHIGQVEVYMNYIDKHVKGITNNKTIGIIVARRDNHYYIEYSSDKRIYTRDYEIV